MANRTRVIDTLKEYFQSKGRVLSAQEYARETDTPIRLQQVRNIFGSWNKVEKLLMAREAPDAITNVDEVLEARNKAAYEAAKQWREASENQDAKALREAEAQHIAEVLAANAATPEGANNNKVAIGGPLPSEQPDYSKLGATTVVDPKTNTQVVVDTKPEIATTAVDDPKTPLELRDFVAQEGVKASESIATGDETSGGSQGTASIATVQAIGGVPEGDKEGVADKSKVADSSDKKVPVTEVKK
jgi:hypothetical protein